MKVHKSHEYKPRKKKKEDKKKATTTMKSTIKVKEKKKMTRKTSIFNTHTKKINEGKEAIPYLLKKSHDGKVIAYKVVVGDKHWNQPIWVPKDIIINMKGPKKVWVPKEPSVQGTREELETWLSFEEMLILYKSSTRIKLV